MDKIIKVDNEWYFRCPGCKREHSLPIAGKVVWSFNGNRDKPTFSPSIKITSVRSPFPPFDATPLICHSFITDGMIQFCSDSTHELAGKTVPLPEYDAETLKYHTCLEDLK